MIILFAFFSELKLEKKDDIMILRFYDTILRYYKISMIKSYILSSENIRIILYYDPLGIHAYRPKIHFEDLWIFL